LQGIVASSGTPWIDTSWFPNTPANSFYWSSSPVTNYTSRVWGFDFYYGSSSSLGGRSEPYSVRLVRASQ
ncbi:MAG: DUF1566 domain-containing protein, partial [Rhodoferax sp.]|nr:DUF1566 domain-containing protein [Rhodoferax sp.]